MNNFLKKKKTNKTVKVIANKTVVLWINRTAQKCANFQINISTARYYR